MNSERYTELLLQYGADPNIFGIIPESDNLTLYTPLQLAIYSNKQLAETLLAYGADVHYLPPTNTLYYPKDLALSKVLTEAKLPTSKISGYKALELPRNNLDQLGRVINWNPPSSSSYQAAKLSPVKKNEEYEKNRAERDEKRIQLLQEQIKKRGGVQETFQRQLHDLCETTTRYLHFITKKNSRRSSRGIVRGGSPTFF